MTLPTPTSTSIETRVAFVGFHRWPDAPEDQGRGYLRDRHRHEFTVRAALGVLHGDREVEFHDLQDLLAETIVPVLGHGSTHSGAAIELDDQSCEQVAQVIAEHLEHWHPGRVLWVSVSEDEQCVARIDYRIQPVAVAG